MATYSFADVHVAIINLGGMSINLGAGSGNTEGGITITMVEDKSTMTIGADGSVMHSLHAGKGANITVRLLKTSPTNAQLSQMYAYDTSASSLYGFNTISVQDSLLNDIVNCKQVAFAKFADVTYAKEGGEMVWTFHSGQTDFVLGAGLQVQEGVVIGTGAGA